MDACRLAAVACESTTSHNVLKDNAEDMFKHTIIMVSLEPFFAVANRCLDVFKMLNNELVSMNSLQQQMTVQNYMSVCFSLLKAEFPRYSEMATTNMEVVVLLDLCVSMERFCS